MLVMDCRERASRLIPRPLILWSPTFAQARAPAMEEIWWQRPES